MRRNWFDTVLATIKRNEARLASASFVGGLINDLLTFTLLPLRYIVVLFGAYVVIAAAATIAAHRYVGREGRVAETVTAFAPLIAHFVLGSVLCGFLILLTQSGAFTISWPFLLLIGVVFVGNELFHTYRRHFIFQALLLYLALISFLVIATPLVLGRINDWSFYLSMALALWLFLAYLWAISATRWDRLKSALVPLLTGAIAITVVIMAAYATRLIPPIPLALRDAGIYTLVERAGDDYKLVGKLSDPWWDPRTPRIVLTPGEPLYAYSAIFAPGAFLADVVHVWQRYDPRLGRWVTLSTVAFTVSGGREEGYRGYSIKSAPQPGDWRVLVQTASGQTIGDIRFSVE